MYLFFLIFINSAKIYNIIYTYYGILIYILFKISLEVFKMNDELLKKYARLAVEMGVNLKENDTLH